MDHAARHPRLAARLDWHMQRAHLTDSALARRMHTNHVNVRRWHKGNVLPHTSETMQQVCDALWWCEADGTPHPLTEAERKELCSLAGHSVAIAERPADQMPQVNPCIIYPSHYARDRFSAGWSRRVIEVEQQYHGDMYTSWNTLPPITRPPTFYQGAFAGEGAPYDEIPVRDYMEKHMQRQVAFEARLESNTVRHLYSQPGIEVYLSGTILDRPAWDVWRLPVRVRIQQVQTILDWLETYPNLEVRLRVGDVPGNITVINDRIVLIELSRSSSLMTSDTINGIEIAGDTAAQGFTRQFNSFWADTNTIKKRTDVCAFFMEQRTLLRSLEARTASS